MTTPLPLGIIAPTMAYHEVVGNLHVHTVYSDGTGLHKDVAAAAQRAGLDFVIATDHNIWVHGVEGYYDGVLLLVGEEVHDVRRLPQASHLLIYGAEAEMVLHAADPQGLIEAVNQRGGLCFLAHPFEKGSPLDVELAPIPWDDWDVEGYVGLELWNTMSEFKGLLWSRLAALVYGYAPTLGFRGPFEETLRRWDALLAEGRKVAVIGGSDAHANTYQMGPFRRVLFPYEDLFRWVNTHVLVEQPLTGNVETDKRLIYDGLRAGRTWVGYDAPGPTRGFRFQARSGANVATIGEELVRAAAVIIDIEVPQRAEIRLIHNGRVVARAKGTSLRHTTAEAGVYRVEAWKRFRGLKRGWIFSSPIYVR